MGHLYATGGCKGKGMGEVLRFIAMLFVVVACTEAHWSALEVTSSSKEDGQ